MITTNNESRITFKHRRVDNSVYGFVRDYLDIEFYPLHPGFVNRIILNSITIEDISKMIDELQQARNSILEKKDS